MGEKENLREYLRDHQIRSMRANMDEWFAFVCYAHSDSDIVLRTVIDLYRKGYNLWIDVANLPIDEHSWEDAALQAIRSDNCRQVLFFRSRQSVTRPAIAGELSTASALDHLRGGIITVDIGDENALHGMDAFFSDVLDGTAHLDTVAEEAARTVFSIVRPDNNALSIRTDADKREIRTLTTQILELPHASQFTRHTNIYDLVLPEEPDDTSLVPAASVRRLLQEDPQCIALTAAVASLCTAAELAAIFDETEDVQPEEEADIAPVPDDFDDEEDGLDFEEDEFAGLASELEEDFDAFLSGLLEDDARMDETEIGDATESVMRAIQEDDSFETLLDALNGSDDLDLLSNTMNTFSADGRMSPLMRALRGDEELAAMLVEDEEEAEDAGTPSFTLGEILADAQAHGDLVLLDVPRKVLEKKLGLLCGMRVLHEHKGRYSLDRNDA